MANQQTKINTNTFVPISFIIIVIVATGWLFTLKSSSDANTRDIGELKTDTKNEQKIFHEKLDTITDRLSNIEGYLKAAIKQAK